jgi:hypothetical protein
MGKCGVFFSVLSEAITETHGPQMRTSLFGNPTVGEKLMMALW